MKYINVDYMQEEIKDIKSYNLYNLCTDKKTFNDFQAKYIGYLQTEVGN